MNRSSFNKYPFLILLVIHSALLIYTFYKCKDRKRLFVLLISNIGIAYLFEYLVLNLFSAYQYSPTLLKNKQLDNIVGAILSQAIYVPFTALFITQFQLGWKAKGWFSIYFFCIEVLFVKMSVYRHNWWRTLYTFVLLPIYFKIGDMWYGYLKRDNPIIQFLSLYHLILTTCINILFIRVITGRFRLGVGWYKSLTEHFKIVGLYSIVLSLFTAWEIRAVRIRSKTVILCFRIIIDYMLMKMKLLKVENDNIFSNLVFHIVMTLVSGYYKNLVYRRREVSG